MQPRPWATMGSGQNGSPNVRSPRFRRQWPRLFGQQLLLATSAVACWRHGSVSSVSGCGGSANCGSGAWWQQRVGGTQRLRRIHQHHPQMRQRTRLWTPRSADVLECGNILVAGGMWEYHIMVAQILSHDYPWLHTNNSYVRRNTYMYVGSTAVPKTRR